MARSTLPFLPGEANGGHGSHDVVRADDVAYGGTEPLRAKEGQRRTAGSAGRPAAWAVVACSSVKSTLEAVAEPVTNVPNAPTAGETSGQAAPMPAAAKASSSVIPAWDMVRAIVTMAISATITGPSWMPVPGR